MYKFVAFGETHSLKQVSVYSNDRQLVIGDDEFFVDIPEGERIHLTVLPNEMIKVEAL